MEETYQVYVKLLNGKHKALNFTSPSIPILSIKSRIREITHIPIHHQRLLTGTKQLQDSSSLLLLNGSSSHPVLHLLLRLRGGKGGFGSLLRGAATKAGQKKTNNFDACRDMSGRRLRHVNAEKKLEEWRAEAEERRLEKVAEEFIKKKEKVAAKKGGGGKGGDAAEKYVDKYREDSAKCREEVEKSVREAIGSHVNLKRKIKAKGSDPNPNPKRLKIWMGKRKVGDSDSDDTDEDDSDDDEEEENEKSIVLDNGNCTVSNKETEGSSDSVTGGKLDGDSSGGGSSESGSEEEKEIAVRSGESSDGGLVGCENSDAGEPAMEILEERIVQNGAISFSRGAEAFENEKQESGEIESGNLEGTEGQHPSVSSSGKGEGFECGTNDAEVNIDSESKPVVHEETVVMSTDVSDTVKPLNFDEFNSAAELEVLGMERLKSELQSRGLKCGGTLQERAARLFLLKTTPLEKLPKKLLAKK
ncbi:unnamed protein product [Camellia sinensis]